MGIEILAPLFLCFLEDKSTIMFCLATEKMLERGKRIQNLQGLQLYEGKSFTTIKETKIQSIMFCWVADT